MRRRQSLRVGSFDQPRGHEPKLSADLEGKETQYRAAGRNQASLRRGSTRWRWGRRVTARCEDWSVDLKRAILVPALGLVMAAALPAVAAAPEEAPRATVRYRGELIQRAELTAWCWPGDNGGTGCSEVSPMPWPRADAVRAGSRLRLRMHWRRRPRSAFVESYRSIGSRGRPQDRGQDLVSRIRPVERNGETVAWDVVFRVRETRHHYVKTIVEFRQGLLVWNAHVEAR